MKQIVSVSLGSSKRDHRVAIELLGIPFEISRLGTDGDFNRALKILQELDGQVDAIGLGGIDVYLYAGGRRFTIRDGQRLLAAVRQTPVVDGSGLKNTLERETVNYLAQSGILPPGTPVLMVSALDRFGMAEAFSRVGCTMTFGDLIFSAGIPYPICSMAELTEIAGKILPEMCKLPFHMLYPTGDKQDQLTNNEKFSVYYEQAQVIAGDFHYIRKYLPRQLKGQMIVTNTITGADVELLRERGAGCLVTTTPEYQGRSFGTNVIEAVLVALLDKPWTRITPDDYLRVLQELEIKPRIVWFSKEDLWPVQAR